MSMFALLHLQVLTNLIKIRLGSSHIQLVTPREILKLFEMLVLLIRYSFSNLRNLWKEPRSKCIPTSCFGKIVSRRRFKATIMNICFSNTSDREVEPLADSRSSLISGFLKTTN